jgi:hypothetical protein
MMATSTNGKLQLESGIGFCAQKHRLQDGFLKAMQRIVALQDQQMRALIEGDNDIARFDILLHQAQEEKEAAKYAWIAHVESHRCERG